MVIPREGVEMKGWAADSGFSPRSAAPVIPREGVEIQALDEEKIPLGAAIE